MWGKKWSEPGYVHQHIREEGARGGGPGVCEGLVWEKAATTTEPILGKDTLRKNPCEEHWAGLRGPSLMDLPVENHMQTTIWVTLSPLAPWLLNWK